MRNVILCVLLLMSLTVTAFGADTEQLLQSLARKTDGALCVVRAEVQNETGRRMMVGIGVCIDANSGLIMTTALDPRISPDTIAKLDVVLPGKDRKTIEAKLMGIDPLTGLSFIQARGDHAWATVAFQKSSSLQLGDQVASVGLILNDPAFSPMLGTGYVSNIRQTPGTVISVTGGTLAPIGSVVFNPKGLAIGLVSSQPYLRYQALSQRGAINMPLRSEDRTVSFMPVEEFVFVFQSIPQDGSVRRLPWIGVGRFVPVSEDLASARNLTGPAVMIDQVIPGGAAERAGLKSRDVIVALDGQPLEAFPAPQLVSQNFVRTLMRKSAGQSITLTVNSGGAEKQVKLTLEPMPQLPSEAKRVFHRNLGLLLREKVMLDEHLAETPAATADGMVVLAVGENTPAERAGLKNGDVVRRVNGKAVTSAEQTKQAIDQALSNNPPLDLRLVVQRGEDTVNLVIPAPKN